MSSPTSSVFGPRDFFGSVDALFTLITSLLTLGEMGKMIQFIHDNVDNGYFDYYRKRDLGDDGALQLLVPRRGGRGGGFGGGRGGGGGGSSDNYAYENYQQAATALFAIGGVLGLLKFATYLGSATKIWRATRGGNYVLAQRATSVLLWNVVGLTVIWAALGIAGLIIDGSIVDNERGNIAPYWSPFWAGYALNVLWVLCMCITLLTTGLLAYTLVMTRRRLKNELHTDEKLYGDAAITPSSAPAPATAPTPIAAAAAAAAAYPPAAQLQHPHPSAQPHAFHQQVPVPQPLTAASSPYTSPPISQSGNYAAAQAAYGTYGQGLPAGTSPLEHNHPVKTASGQGSGHGGRESGAFSPALLSGLPGSGPSQAPSAPAGWTVSPSS
ncbi:hypothetical protein OC844_002493 [Tilletia horrida]|nr:hypothetical protein OC844_002493 [Tilletia horrida]